MLGPREQTPAPMSGARNAALHLQQLAPLPGRFPEPTSLPCSSGGLQSHGGVTYREVRGWGPLCMHSGKASKDVRTLNTLKASHHSALLFPGVFSPLWLQEALKGGNRLGRLPCLPSFSQSPVVLSSWPSQ